MKNQILLRLAIVLCIVSMIIAVVAVICSESQRQVFTPPPFDENAQQGTPEVPENLGWNEVDARVYRAMICGVLVLDGSQADVWFANPDDNAVWLKLRILDERGNLLGETGVIRPGEYVQTVLFDVVPPQGSAVCMKIVAYEPDTYYSAGTVTLNTTISDT